MSCEVLLIGNGKQCQAEFSAVNKTLEDLRDNPTSSGFTEEKVVGNKGKVDTQTKDAFTSDAFSSFCL